MSSSSITSRLGASVRNLRNRMGLSQEELAERSELHRTYIAGIERGARNVTLKTIEKLADALRVSVVTLLSSARAGREEATESGFVDILMVEDTPDDVELTLQAFQHSRIANRLTVVRDGAEALDYLFARGSYAWRRGEPLPQLILLDLNLPKVGGLEVLRTVKRDERTRHIPVIVLTVSREHRDVSESRSLGADTYIVKPIDLQGLSRATPHLGFRWALLERA